MKFRSLVASGFAAVLLATMVALPYWWHFRSRALGEPEQWGQFGDYLAGILNPLFAMLAFLAVLYSISLQRAEARRLSERFEAEQQVSRTQLAELVADRTASELLRVIQDIDARLSVLSSRSVSPAGAQLQLSYSLLVAEGDRIRTQGGTSPAYSAFLVHAKASGSVVEALVREIGVLVDQMQTVLTQFSEFRGTSQAPLIVYYAHKTLRLLTPLEDAVIVGPYARATLASVSDKHH
jgi:hypothetical protein